MKTSFPRGCFQCTASRFSYNARSLAPISGARASPLSPWHAAKTIPFPAAVSWRSLSPMNTGCDARSSPASALSLSFARRGLNSIELARGGTTHARGISGSSRMTSPHVGYFLPNPVTASCRSPGKRGTLEHLLIHSCPLFRLPSNAHLTVNSPAPSINRKEYPRFSRYCQLAKTAIMPATRNLHPSNNDRTALSM